MAQGIDLSAHYADVRRLIFAHPAFRAALSEGIEEEDLAQEVMARLVARQSMSSRWDPARGTMSTYVWQFTRSAVGHILRRHRVRQRRQESEDQACDGLDEWGQLLRAANELGLSADDIELVRRVLDGELRRDDGRVVALGERVAALVYG